MYGDYFNQEEYHRRAKQDFYSKDMNYFLMHWLQPFEKWEQIDSFFPAGNMVDIVLGNRPVLNDLKKQIINWVIAARAVAYFFGGYCLSTKKGYLHYYNYHTNWKVGINRTGCSVKLETDKYMGYSPFESPEAVRYQKLRQVMDFCISRLEELLQMYKSNTPQAEIDKEIDIILCHMYRWEKEF